MDSVLCPEATAIAIAEPPKKCAKKGSIFDYIDENGQLVNTSPTTMLWYRMYAANNPNKVRGKHKLQENKF
jgi:hypothetical protein